MKSNEEDTDSEIDLKNIHLPYSNNKIHLNTKQYYSQLLSEDLEILEKDHKFKVSCGEEHLLPYVQ